MSAIVGALLIVVIILSAAFAVWIAVAGFPKSASPVLASLDGHACATSGRWTVARFAVMAASDSLPLATLRATDDATGRSTRSSGAPLVLSALAGSVGAGDRVWLTTQPGHPEDVACDGGRGATFAHAPSGTVLDDPAYVAAPAFVMALTDERCRTSTRDNAFTFTLQRVPPGFRGRDLRVDDLTTGESTAGSGHHLRLSGAGGAADLVPGQALTVRTQARHPAQMACSDTLALVDEVSGATLRTTVLHP